MKRLIALHGTQLQNIPFAYDGRSTLITSRKLAKDEYTFEKVSIPNSSGTGAPRKFDIRMNSFESISKINFV